MNGRCAFVALALALAAHAVPVSAGAVGHDSARRPSATCLAARATYGRGWDAVRRDAFRDAARAFFAASRNGAGCSIGSACPELRAAALYRGAGAEYFAAQVARDRALSVRAAAAFAAAERAYRSLAHLAACRNDPSFAVATRRDAHGAPIYEYDGTTPLFLKLSHEAPV